MDNQSTVDDAIAEAGSNIKFAKIHLARGNTATAVAFSVFARTLLNEAEQNLNRMLENGSREKPDLERLLFRIKIRQGASYELEAMVHEMGGMAGYETEMPLAMGHYKTEHLKTASMNYGHAYEMLAKAAILSADCKKTGSAEKNYLEAALERIAKRRFIVFYSLGVYYHNIALQKINETLKAEAESGSLKEADAAVAPHINAAVAWYNLAMHVSEEAAEHNMPFDQILTGSLKDGFKKLSRCVAYVKHAMRKEWLRPKGQPNHEVRVYVN